MNNLLKRIQAGEIIIADGAMGTMLIEHGLKIGECPELFNLEQAEIVADITRAYLEAGAEILQTNTFGGSPLKLAAYAMDSRCEEINRRAVEIARKVVGNKAMISGSCGPSGKILKPYGDTEPDRVYQSFKKQIKALIEAGVDLLTVETMVDLEEARLAIRGARDISKDIPIMATMTFDPTSNGFFTIMGVTIEQAAAGLKDAGANIIGSNCGNGVENMIKIAQAFRKATDLPLVIQSNAGMPHIVNSGIIYDETPEFMAEKALSLAKAGVAVIGGCCGTGPEHIRAIKARVKK